MARRKQEVVESYSVLDSMLDHTLYFTKVLTVWSFINIVYALVVYVLNSQMYTIYGFVLSLILPYLWCKLRRYRLRDKAKLSYIYLTLIMSCLLQLALSNGVFQRLLSKLMEIGG